MDMPIQTVTVMPAVIINSFTTLPNFPVSSVCRTVLVDSLLFLMGYNVKGVF